MPVERISPPATPREQCEIENIFHHFKGIEGNKLVYQLINDQLNVLHARAQSVLQLCGVVITVTGFSGRIIADTNDTAQWLIVTGLALVSLGAAVTLIRVTPIRWLSSYMHLHPEDWLLTALRRRAVKNQALRVATVLVTLGMIFYLASIALMLLHPEATELTRVR